MKVKEDILCHMKNLTLKRFWKNIVLPKKKQILQMNLRNLKRKELDIKKKVKRKKLKKSDFNQIKFYFYKIKIFQLNQQLLKLTNIKNTKIS